MYLAGCIHLGARVRVGEQIDLVARANATSRPTRLVLASQVQFKSVFFLSVVFEIE